MTMTSSVTTSSDHSGNAEITPTCAIALSVAMTIAVQRAQLRPAISANPVVVMNAPSRSCTQPQVVKSAIRTPRPPTWTTSSLRIAASPHIELKKPDTHSMMPANSTQPLGMYSSAGADVRRSVAVVDMAILSDGSPYATATDELSMVPSALLNVKVRLPVAPPCTPETSHVTVVPTFTM